MRNIRIRSCLVFVLHLIERSDKPIIVVEVDCCPDSLTLSSDVIRHDTHAQVSENHQIALSHIAAATAQSAVYRAEQLQARKLFADMEIVSPEYACRLAATEALLRQKTELLDGLWNQWQSLTDGIKGLCDEGLAMRPEIASDVKAEESEEEGVVTVEEHMKGVYESLIGLREKWVKKMEDSEKVCDVCLLQRDAMEDKSTDALVRRTLTQISRKSGEWQL